MSEDRKDTSGKYNPLLLPWEAKRAYALVSNNGLEVYGNRYSWKENNPTDGVDKYLQACERHIDAYSQISGIDAKSHLPHVYHVLWNACAAVWHYERSIEHDKAAESPWLADAEF